MSFLSRRSVFAAAALAVAAAFVAPASAQEKLNVGVYSSNPPWEFKNDKGEFEGFEVDLVKEIGKRLNMGVELTPMEFQALFAATSSKRVDIAISSITITPKRLESQSFAQAYYDSDLGMAAKKASSLNKLDDLKGKTVGVLSTSTGDMWAKENQAKYGYTIKGYNAQTEMLLDLGNGRVDAVITDVPGLEFAFVKTPDLVVKDRIKTGEEYSLMMTKNHPLLEKINAIIGDMKKDGSLAAIHKKWFGTDPQADSSTAKVKPLPKL
jgi:polar amino acid transport system substrate-binding protein